MLDALQLPFAQRALVELLLLAVLAGTLGTWIVLRSLAFVAHGAAAAAFPGVIAAHALGLAAWLGGLAAALAFALAVGRLSAHDADGPARATTTALVLVGALALGALLASDVVATPAAVDTLLFGSLLAIGPDDLRLAAATALVALLANRLLGPRWLATGLDAAAARGLGLRSTLPELALLALVALAAVATLAAVGALLATALLVVPAATARLLTRRVPSWQLATAALAAAEGMVALWLAIELNAPPGATLAVTSGAAFALTALARARRTRPAGAPA